MKKLYFLLFLCLPSLLLSQDDTVTVMFYNLLNYPSDGGGIPTREDTLYKIVQASEVDILGVCELDNATSGDLILNNSFNVAPITNFARATYVSNTSTGNNLQNLVFYNTDKVTLHSSIIIPTDLRDINRYRFYANDPNLAVHNDTTFIDYYVTHLKASTGAANEARRDLEATSFRTYVDALPSEGNIVLGADFNVYTSTEPAYITLTSGGTYPMIDPISRPGAWNNNAAFADVHSQCTRATSAIPDGAWGGMDDRFDQILVGNNVMTGAERVRYIPNTYTAYGNDGNHFNDDIHGPAPNVAVGQNIATALYYMSDHLPIVMDLEITYASTLPLEIHSFVGEQVQDKVDLELSLSLLPGTEVVELQRSVDGLDFISVGEGAPLPSSLSHKWIDNYPAKGVNHYRLKMTEQDGTVLFSKVCKVNFTPQGQFDISFKNPSRGRLLTFVRNSESFQGQIELVSVEGKSVYKSERFISKGIEEFYLDFETVPSGVYLLKLTNPKTGFGTAKRLSLIK